MHTMLFFFRNIFPRSVFSIRICILNILVAQENLQKKVDLGAAEELSIGGDLRSVHFSRPIRIEHFKIITNEMAVSIFRISIGGYLRSVHLSQPIRIEYFNCYQWKASKPIPHYLFIDRDHKKAGFKSLTQKFKGGLSLKSLGTQTIAH